MNTMEKVTAFSSEAEFEKTFIETLRSYGNWDDYEVLKNPSEEDLLNNWADILFNNNNTIDRLNGQPLTKSEMQQIVAQLNELRTPLNINGFIKGKTISIKRDNEKDKAHFGKEISLKIYEPREIGKGQSRYQIVQQPKFPTKSKMLNDRRGDVMLLINGMPLIHIELKKSGVSVSQAAYQIENYARSGIFTGLFSMVQIFIAMNPEDAVYFANPGPDGKFNPDYYFHWADISNRKIKDWKTFSKTLLTVPMVHQLVGLYTIADKGDGVLKVMRSYQYHASSAISDKVAVTDWSYTDKTKHLGGFIWHTTGSGKTMTSFKSAQLIANSKDADKVIFLMDRIELGTQSLKAYNHFTEDNEEVQATEDTQVLINKLKSNDTANTLIVSSIQKMSNITEDGLRSDDIAKINKKRIVIIVDEAHRSTFGDMLVDIKTTFSNALFFGFTGTPIRDENKKKDSTTTTVFGEELHRYTLADGITDGNVLGFDPYKVLIYKDKDLRKAVALAKSKAVDVKDAMDDPKKKEVYNHFMNKVPMAGTYDDNNKYESGIEDYIPKSQFETEDYYNEVVSDIVNGWYALSQGNKFHAILATSSIPDAINYYRKFKDQAPHLKVTALFDSTIDNNGAAVYKEDGLVELMEDYNATFGQNFVLATHAKFKRDIAARLAHKQPYERIETTPEKQLDILIVVDQMLTGFDSKWVNTLYMDKLMRYEHLIQALSRTNRLFGEDKPFGTIRYYKFPHTMQRNIDDAVKLYSGDKPVELFVNKLDKNLTKLNNSFKEITRLFKDAGIENFSKPLTERAERGQFAKLFNEFNYYLECAKVQGFSWKQKTYNGFEDKTLVIEVVFEESQYLTLVQRYKEMFNGGGLVIDGDGDDDIPFDIKPHITEIDTGKIDSDYMNSRFDKFIKSFENPNITEEEKEKTLKDLRKSYAGLTQEQQKYAGIFLRDIQRGDVTLASGKNFMDYIISYQQNAENDSIKKVASTLGLDEVLLRELMAIEFSMAKFNRLKETVNKEKAKLFFESKEGKNLSIFKVNTRVDKFLRNFLNGEKVSL